MKSSIKSVIIMLAIFATILTASANPTQTLTLQDDHNGNCLVIKWTPDPALNGGGIGTYCFLNTGVVEYDGPVQVTVNKNAINFASTPADSQLLQGGANLNPVRPAGTARFFPNRRAPQGTIIQDSNVFDSTCACTP